MAEEQIPDPPEAPVYMDADQAHGWASGWAAGFAAARAEAPRVRVVNPETGADLFPTHRVELHASHAQESKLLTTVKISPSFRPRMPYDLATYPAEWIQEAR